MQSQKKHFTYKSLAELQQDVTTLGVDISFEESFEAMRTPLNVGNRIVGNPLGIHPMEGCDGNPDGSPGELTFRRWKRFAEGGAKLIWGEATAVVPEGKANPRQLWIRHSNLANFKELVNVTRTAHREKFGTDSDLLLGLQLTHSGRWSCEKPIIVCRQTGLDRRTRFQGVPIGNDYPVVTDEYLEQLEDAYVRASVLARDAGFDFVDVKQCHTYLLNELLCAREREGRYGGSFENRTRFIRNVLSKLRAAAGDSIIPASRINAFDGIPYGMDAQSGFGIPDEHPIPYEDGFGIDRNNPLLEDLKEPLELVQIMAGNGISLINVSLGSPYFNPHIGRPFERPNTGGYFSPEHPLFGVDRHFRITGEIQKRFPELVIVGTGYSWLQNYFIHAAEANIRSGRVAIAAVGRGALAYPEFARDALDSGRLNKRRVCLAVSYCTDLMREKQAEFGQSPTGCVPRDPLYADIYKKVQEAKKDL